VSISAETEHFPGYHIRYQPQVLPREVADFEDIAVFAAFGYKLFRNIGQAFQPAQPRSEWQTLREKSGILN